MIILIDLYSNVSNTSKNAGLMARYFKFACSLSMIRVSSLSLSCLGGGGGGFWPPPKDFLE